MTVKWHFLFLVQSIISQNVIQICFKISTWLSWRDNVREHLPFEWTQASFDVQRCQKAAVDVDTCNASSGRPRAPLGVAFSCSSHFKSYRRDQAPEIALGSGFGVGSSKTFSPMRCQQKCGHGGAT